MNKTYITFTGTCPSKNICGESSNCLKGDFNSKYPKTSHPYIPLYITCFNGEGYYICEPTQPHPEQARE